jgi:hypothetical protein
MTAAAFGRAQDHHGKHEPSNNRPDRDDTHKRPLLAARGLPDSLGMSLFDLGANEGVRVSQGRRASPAPAWQG